MYTANDLKTGKLYAFTAKALEGSSANLMTIEPRLFSAIYQGRVGGDLFFLFNGQPLYIDPSVEFEYDGYGPHGGRKSRKSRKTRRTRKTKRSRKSRRSKKSRGH